MRGQHLVRRESRKRRAAREHLVRHRAKGVDVRPVVDVGIPGGLFGRHVRGRAERHADGGEAAFGLGLADRFGHPEIGDDGVVAGEQHVVRLDVAMHHTARVGVRERIRDVLQNADRILHRELAVAAEARA